MLLLVWMYVLLSVYKLSIMYHYGTYTERY